MSGTSFLELPEQYEQSHSTTTSEKISDGTITKRLRRLRNDLCTNQNLPGISDTRKEVIAGGLSILIALFESLRLEQLQAHPFALREGVL